MVSDELEIVVTGANGLVGLEVLRTLRQQWKDASVKAFVRREPEFRLPGVTYIRGSLPDAIPTDLFEARKIILIHCASLVKGADLSGYRLVNVEGTRKLLERAGPRLAQVIYCSSMSVYGQGPFTGVTEVAPTNPETDLAHSRLEAEHVVAEFMTKLNGSAFILRPRFLLSTRDRETLPGLIKLSKSRLRLGSERQRLSFILVEDYARIIVHLARNFHREQRREIINTCYPQPIELGTLLRMITPSVRFPRLFLPVKPLLKFGPPKLRTKLQLIGQSQQLNAEKLLKYFPEIQTSDELAKLARVIEFHTGVKKCP